MSKRATYGCCAVLGLGLVVCVSARVWWLALHDPFASPEISQRLLLGTTQEEAAQIIGRPPDRTYSKETLRQQHSAQVLARFGVPEGGCADWLQAPVGIRLDFDATG